MPGGGAATAGGSSAALRGFASEPRRLLGVYAELAEQARMRSRGGSRRLSMLTTRSAATLGCSTSDATSHRCARALLLAVTDFKFELIDPSCAPTLVTRRSWVQFPPWAPDPPWAPRGGRSPGRPGGAGVRRQPRLRRPLPRLQRHCEDCAVPRGLSRPDGAPVRGGPGCGAGAHPGPSPGRARDALLVARHAASPRLAVRRWHGHVGRGR